jgi:hypothetical protein
MLHFCPSALRPVPDVAARAAAARMRVKLLMGVLDGLGAGEWLSPLLTLVL